MSIFASLDYNAVISCTILVLPSAENVMLLIISELHDGQNKFVFYSAAKSQKIAA